MASDSPVCSVIVRCYNEERHIGRLLEGILQQTVRDAEIIVVDSGSTDGTLGVVKKYPVTLVEIRKEDFSFGYSLNAGCRRARGDFLVLASAHVYPSSERWLENLLEPFSDPPVAVVYGKQRGDERTHFSEEQIFRTWYPDRSVRRQSHPFCNNANAAIRRADWEVHHYDESLTGLEDIAWAKAALARGRRIVYAADAEIIHVHEETARQIYRRYKREAMALKIILPESRLGLLALLHLSLKNIWADWMEARRQRVFWRHAADVVLFRCLQFWGTYRGFAQEGPLNRELRTRLYYPRARMRPAGNPPSRRPRRSDPPSPLPQPRPGSDRGL